MGEKIAGWIEKFATGKTARLFWGVVIFVIIAFVISFPYFDANFLFYSRTETRIDNLQKLVSISGTTIVDEPELLSEYQDILQDMKKARETSTINTASDVTIKFWSGALLCIAIGIVGLLDKSRGRLTLKSFLTNNLFIFGGCLLLGTFGGLIAVMIPTFGWVWINAILMPLAQIFLLFFFIIKDDK